VCDSGTPFIDGMSCVLGGGARVDAGRRPAWSAHPDLVYPKGDAGGYRRRDGLLIEAALGRRFPGHGLVFDRLGKPGPQLFAEARRRVGGRVVMIGDQLETDIAGACAAGIDAALLAGVSRWPPARPADSPSPASGIAPRYLLATIEP
jgi:ribonucleotide monophosphatase NagD (HAD superfamily)